MMEFVARVKAVLRRSARQNEDKELHYDELYLNVGRHEVHYREEKVDLTRKEFELLQYLLENKGLVMTRIRSSAMYGDMTLTVKPELWMSM